MLFTPDERRAILAVVGLLALGLAVRLVHPGPPPPEGGGDSLLVVLARESEAGAQAKAPSAGLVEEGRIRVNLASESDLVRLPGIGPALARRILESRGSVGPFASIADLRRVKGIGPKIAARLEPLVSFAVDSAVSAGSEDDAEATRSDAGADRNGGLHRATRDSGRTSMDGSER